MEEPQTPVEKALAVIYGSDGEATTWEQDREQMWRIERDELTAQRALGYAESQHQITTIWYRALWIHATTGVIDLQTKFLQQKTEDIKEVMRLEAELEHLQAEEKKGELRRKIEAFRTKVQCCKICGTQFNMQGLQVTKRRKVCTRDVKGNIIGNPECVKRQDIERHSKQQVSRSSRNGQRPKTLKGDRGIISRPLA